MAKGANNQTEEKNKMPEEQRINPERIKDLLRAIIDCKSLATVHRMASSTLKLMERRERGDKEPPKSESEDFTDKTCSVCGFSWVHCTCSNGPDLL